MKLILKKIIDLLPKGMKYQVYRNLVSVSNNVDDIFFKLAETQDELEGAFSVLHNSYVEVGLMKKDPSGLRVTPYHALNSTVTLIGKKGSEVIATVTIISDSKLGLPSENFIDLSNLRQGGNRIAEISALAIKKEYRGRVLLHLLKFMYEWCINYSSINHLIATLTTDSKAYELYEAVLFFKRIENKIEANYAFSNYRPVIAEHLNLDEAKTMIKKAYNGKCKFKDLYSFFVEEKSKQFQFPERTFFSTSYPVMDINKFSYFFCEKTQALSNMSEKSLLNLRNTLGNLPQVTLIDSELKKRKVYAISKFSNKNRFDVSMNVTASSTGKVFSIRILNVSKNGLKIYTSQTIQNAIKISVESENGKTYSIQAKKIWQDSNGVYGLEIIKTERNWQKMINSLEGHEYSKAQVA